MKSGHDHEMIFGAMHSMNIRRIEAGILDSGSDFDTSMTPFEAGLERLIDLKKDQFIGKEALLSAKRGKRLYGLTCKDLTPCRGDAIFAENVQVGVVTTGAQSPFLAVGIGYVRFYEAGLGRAKSCWCMRAVVGRRNVTFSSRRSTIATSKRLGYFNRRVETCQDRTAKACIWGH